MPPRPTGHTSRPLTDRPDRLIDLYAECPDTAPTPERLMPRLRRQPSARRPNRRNLRRPTRTPGYAAGHTCSASAATSSPKPAATPSPSSILRDTRVTYRRTRTRTRARLGTIRADHVDDETTLIVGTLTFAGAGWHTIGDALLANTAAALARQRPTVTEMVYRHQLRPGLLEGAAVMDRIFAATSEA